MKHPPVLMLGLATLVLSFPIQSSASASAKEPLTFDPPGQSISYAAVRDAPGSSRSIRGSNSTMAALADEKQAPDRLLDEPSHESLKEFSEDSFDRENLPLFELPPFQSSPSESSPPSDSSFSAKENHPQQKQPQLDSRSDLGDGYSSSQSSDSSDLNASDSPSPFQLPDELTDADLFESEQEPKVQADADKPDISSPTDLEVKSNSAPENGGLPSPNSSVADQFRLRDHGRGRNAERKIPSTSEVLSESSGSSPSSSLSEKTIGLSFDPPVATKPSSPVAQSIPSPVSTAPSSSAKNDETAGGDHSLDRLFKGDSDSIVAVAVGSAEGTRTPDGGKNPAYQGHTDPGNGVWNLGSFSYQHGASSPEEADAKQLTRLRNQAEIILNKAAAKGLDLSLEEKLNGIDLANQAPKAALDDYGGYIDWLLEARNKGLGGHDAILWARVNSFLDPVTQTWNAPGLGNTEERITSDQERRMLAIAEAIATYMQDIAKYSPSS